MGRKITEYIEVNIPITREEYIFHQRHLLNSKQYEDYGPEGTVAIFDIDIAEEYNMTFYIRNCQKECGGPYIDPVLFKKRYRANGKYELQEWCSGDVLDDLDSTISFIINGKEYNFGFTVKKGE
jgi:hypothetical protein